MFCAYFTADDCVIAISTTFLRLRLTFSNGWADNDTEPISIITHNDFFMITD
ncbi:MAG: hypothetical protein JXA39_08400 [Bacteroidales bacterium]|nr:hypothetical protein [Bacteroidales bacterium]